MLSPAELSQLEYAASSAVACEQTTNVPAELTVAQWALESGWGAHQPGNNCFGIKAYNGCFGVQTLPTAEVIKGERVLVPQQFAAFPTLDACFAQHAAILTSKAAYQLAWIQYLLSKDLNKLIAEIAPIYATDPAYAAILLRITVMPQVQAALEACRKPA